jgi:cytochrome c oxidase subunit 1
MSSLGATVLGLGYLLPMLYFVWSLFKGERVGANPWLATGLEWTTQSPPLAENFPVTPVVTEGAYEYSKREIKVA